MAKITCDYKLRVIVDKEGCCWWVASDICNLLDITSLKDAMGLLNKDEKSLIKMYKNRQKKYIINKSGLKKLISKSSQKDILEDTDLWTIIRNQGKIVRKEETEVIQQFIEYAIDQGADEDEVYKYYAYITKEENKAILDMDEAPIDNLRDSMSVVQLQSTILADRTVIESLKTGMKRKMFYKDVYDYMKEELSKL